MSLSTDPALSALRDHYICGYKNIANKRYAGASGKHEPTGNAVETTNGAGPHNIQIFVLAPDGTVLHCLPGYWCGEDLLVELEFANAMWDLYKSDQSAARKAELFAEANLQHIAKHPREMTKRSKLQHFDVLFEKDRLAKSDVFWSTGAIARNPHGDLNKFVKTADVIVHQRMASRPFLPYEKFDVAAYSDYGKPMYDKHEDRFDEHGKVLADAPASSYIGNDPRAHPLQTAVKKGVKRHAKRAIFRAIQVGVSSMRR